LGRVVAAPAGRKPARAMSGRAMSGRAMSGLPVARHGSMGAQS
jgi:hypothetical protein